MGASLSCIEDVPSLQRLEYDMTPIKGKSLPIVWLAGPPGSGRSTQAKLLAETLQFEEIPVVSLLRQETQRDTDRARLIREGLNHRGKKVPDSIVIDLIKEEMLRKSSTAKGFIVNNFPRTSKQASLFVKEIDDVDAAIYLACDSNAMIDRVRAKTEEEDEKFDEEVTKKRIANYAKEVKEALSRYGRKLAKIKTDEAPAVVHERIEAVINMRISTKTKITAESDYAQSQKEESEIQSIT